MSSLPPAVFTCGWWPPCSAPLLAATAIGLDGTEAMIIKPKIKHEHTKFMKNVIKILENKLFIIWHKESEEKKIVQLNNGKFSNFTEQLCKSLVKY
jgi:hypothetical protein